MGADTPHSTPPYPLPSRVHMAPAASLQGLSIFLERCEASGTLSLAMLWADLTTSFSAVTVKSCVPSQQCFRWNCACGRQVRTVAARSRPGQGDAWFLRFLSASLQVTPKKVAVCRRRSRGLDPTKAHRRTSVFFRLVSPVMLEFCKVGVHMNDFTSLSCPMSTAESTASHGPDHRSDCLSSGERGDIVAGSFRRRASE